MSKRTAGRSLVTISYIALVLMLAVQLFLMISFDGQQYSDFAEYVTLAHSSSGLFPQKQDLYTTYIHAPGYVNLLRLLFAAWDSIRVVCLLNILSVLALLASTRHIVLRLAGQRAGYLYQILFCLYFAVNMSGGIVQANTEMPFCALAFGAVALCIEKKYPMTGILLALANWIRPVTFLFVPCILWLILASHVSCKAESGREGAEEKAAGRQKSIRQLAHPLLLTLAPMAAAMVLIGTATYASCGHFITSSTTMGVNLLVGNSPSADGNNQYRVFEEGNYGYTDPAETAQWTYEDYDARYKQLAISWMKENPAQVIRLVPARMLYLWATDTYFSCGWCDNETMTDTTDYYLGLFYKITGADPSGMSAAEINSCLAQAYYMALLLLFFLALIRQIRCRRIHRLLPIYSILVIGVALHCVMFGYARFHFPFLPVILMGIAAAAETQPKSSRNSMQGSEKMVK